MKTKTDMILDLMETRRSLVKRARIHEKNNERSDLRSTIFEIEQTTRRLDKLIEDIEFTGILGKVYHFIFG